MERITATFLFTENYQHSNRSRQDASVKLYQEIGVNDHWF